MSGARREGGCRRSHDWKGNGRRHRGGLTRLDLRQSMPSELHGIGNRGEYFHCPARAYDTERAVAEDPATEPLVDTHALDLRQDHLKRATMDDAGLDDHALGSDAELAG